MPTILLFDGLRVVIYPNDHRPAHVHVIGPGIEVVFDLRCADGLPEVRENYGFSRQALSKVADALADKQALLCEKWSEFHEHF